MIVMEFWSIHFFCEQKKSFDCKWPPIWRSLSSQLDDTITAFVKFYKSYNKPDWTKDIQQRFPERFCEWIYNYFENDQLPADPRN